ncbi:DUF4401 domain-containing protein [Shewanella profunda]|uniref:DUF4401 domain-containing protein n=1 Tax=Shewanella profunda TaxID=254793 RepID=UPI00200E56B9|nr:DUF4401 domain-containing protein [Shewanella profunda]MCL1090490.1 DUF4401 domain-containing protein [Shewanella profunda]
MIDKATQVEDKLTIESVAESSSAKLWQALYVEGKVSSPQMPESHDMPWYVAAMQAFAAWIAAWFLLGFMASLLDAIFERVEGYFALFIGLTYLGIGVGLYFLPRQQTFVQQFAFAASLSGLLGVAWGLFDLLGNDFSLAWYFCMGIILLCLWGLITHGLAQLVFAFCLSWCVIGVMAKLHLLNLSQSIFALLISLLILNINQLGRHYRRVRMLTYGFALTLLSVQLIHAFSMDNVFEEWFSPWRETLWLTLTHLLIIFAICSFLLVSIFRERQQSLTSLAALGCAMGLVLVSGLSLPMQGLSTAILLILLGHYSNELWLKWMGIASAILFVSGYYYSLETTLMLKSWYLMGLGALLLMARIGMWQLFPENQNAKESL